MNKDFSLEKAFSSIDEIIEKLECSEISFEESVELYEKAMKMIKTCSTYLTEMEGIINKVVDPVSGKLEEFNEKI